MVTVPDTEVVKTDGVKDEVIPVVLTLSTVETGVGDGDISTDMLCVFVLEGGGDSAVEGDGVIVRAGDGKTVELIEFCAPMLLSEAVLEVVATNCVAVGDDGAMELTRMELVCMSVIVGDTGTEEENVKVSSVTVVAKLTERVTACERVLVIADDAGVGVTGESCAIVLEGSCVIMISMLGASSVTEGSCVVNAAVLDAAGTDVIITNSSEGENCGVDVMAKISTEVTVLLGSMDSPLSKGRAAIKTKETNWFVEPNAIFQTEIL